MATPQTLAFTTPARSNGFLHGIVAAVAEMLRAAETRRQLAQLDRRMLADIGIGRAEALAEADRAPWDLSRHRR